MLKEQATEKRKERHHITQEDFTPESVLKILCPPDGDPLYNDFSLTLVDPCMGTGNIILYVYKKRLEGIKMQRDKVKALSTLYGTELMEDNVEEFRDRLKELLKESYTDEIDRIAHTNFVGGVNALTEWDFDNWKRKSKTNTKKLF
jgi:hypothetical protein